MAPLDLLATSGRGFSRILPSSPSTAVDKPYHIIRSTSGCYTYSCEEQVTEGNASCQSVAKACVLRVVRVVFPLIIIVVVVGLSVVVGNVVLIPVPGEHLFHCRAEEGCPTKEQEDAILDHIPDLAVSTWRLQSNIHLRSISHEEDLDRQSTKLCRSSKRIWPSVLSWFSGTCVEGKLRA